MINKNNLKTGRRIDKRYRPTPRTKMEKIGIPTGLYDKFGNEILSGSIVHISPDYNGIVLYHRDCKAFGLFFGLWYGDKNPYDPDCYGKYIMIPKDNGMRMEIEIIE